MAIACPETRNTAAELSRWYDEHAAALFRFALHLTGRREDAEDVVQHVFLQAYGALERGEELMYPKAWLMRATRNRSLNLIRDRRELASEHVLEAAATPAPAEGLETLGAVRASLWALPESQHQAFVLRHWSGLSQEEIADVLDTTPSAVESLLVRARTALVNDRDSTPGECVEVRRRLVDLAELASGQLKHLNNCRRCRTAQSRLARATGLAGALALAPSLHVAHDLSGAIPGFSPGVASAAVTAPVTGTAAGGGAVTSGAGASGAVSGSVATTMSLTATKAALVAKIAVAALTATAAVATVQPVRAPLVAGLSAVAADVGIAHRTHASVVPPVTSTGGGPGGGGTATGGATNTATGGASGTSGETHGKAGETHGNAGKANGKAGETHGNAGKANGKAGETHGNAGKANGQSKTTATGNGNGNGKAKGSANGNAGGGVKATGSGKTTGAGKTTGSGKTPGTGNGKGNGNGGSTGTTTDTGTTTTTTAGNGNGNGNGAGGNGKGNGKQPTG